MVSKQLERSLVLVFLILVGFFLRVHQLSGTPPGLSYDEGYNAFEALQLSRSLEPAIFYAENNGREPLHIVVYATFIQLLGNRPWSMRLATVFVSLLTIPVVYLVGRDFYRGNWRDKWSVGILSAAVVATLFWHVTFSRFVLRAPFMLPLTALSVLFFWWGWQRQKMFYFLLSGLCLGLSLYTYLPARLMPLVFVGWTAVQLLLFLLKRQPKSLAELWRGMALPGLALTLMAAALVFLPLGLYFANHPEAFLERIQQTAVVGGEKANSDGNPLLENGAAAVRMFFDRGEMEPWYNLPGKPALGNVAALGFAVGLALAVWRLKDARYPLLLLWLFFMLVPTIFSHEAPKFIRVVGVIPPMCVLAGSGLYWLWQRANGVVNGRLSPFWWPIITLFVIVSGLLTYRDYFHRWMQPALNSVWYSVEENNLYDQLLTLSEDYDVMIPGYIYYHVNSRYILESNFSEVIEVDDSLPIRPVVYLYPTGHCRLQRVMILFHRPDGQLGQQGITQVMPTADVPIGPWLLQPNVAGLEGETLSFGFIRKLYGEGDTRPGFVPAAAVGATLSEQASTSSAPSPRLCLVGYELEDYANDAGETTFLTLHWENLHSFGMDYIVDVQLVSPEGQLLGEIDRQFMSGSRWRPGEVMATKHFIFIPESELPGKYRFRTTVTPALDSQPTAQSLILVNDMGGYLDEFILTGSLTVKAKSETYPFTQPVDIAFGDPHLFSLEEFSLNATQFLPGDFLEIDLTFESYKRSQYDYTFFLHLLDDSGQLWAQQDIEPMNGRAPTSLWLPGEQIVDRRTLPLDAPIPPGEYTLAIGAYFWADGSRLPLFKNGRRLPEDRFLLPVKITIAE